jgi:hypothetical protein
MVDSSDADTIEFVEYLSEIHRVCPVVAPGATYEPDFYVGRGDSTVIGLPLAPSRRMICIARSCYRANPRRTPVRSLTITLETWIGRG